jgi:D-alanine-D-alanine ligase
MCPGHFSRDEHKGIEEMAKSAHRALGMRHYSRSDFIITPKGKIYILETNSLPGFTAESLLPKSLHAVGFHPRDFVDHVLRLAM